MLLKVLESSWIENEEDALFDFFFKNEMGWINYEVNMKWMEGLECCGDLAFAKISFYNYCPHSLKSSPFII